MRIIVRGDSDFSRDETMTFCEAIPGVDYVFGLKTNSRLAAAISKQLAAAKQECEMTGEAARIFKLMHVVEQDPED